MSELTRILHMFRRGQGHMVDPADIDALDKPEEKPEESGEEEAPNATE